MARPILSPEWLAWPTAEPHAQILHPLQVSAHLVLVKHVKPWLALGKKSPLGR